MTGVTGCWMLTAGGTKKVLVDVICWVHSHKAQSPVLCLLHGFMGLSGVWEQGIVVCFPFVLWMQRLCHQVVFMEKHLSEFLPGQTDVTYGT